MMTMKLKLEKKDILTRICHAACFIVAMALMYINLYYMHDTIVSDIIDFHPLYNYSSKVYIMFDITALLMFFSIITFGKRKFAYACTYFTLLVWILINIVYSRFFHQYFVISALGETSNFKGAWWFCYLGETFRPSDILLIITTAYFIFEVFIRKSTKHIWNSKVNWYIILPAPLVIVLVHVFIVLPLFYREKVDISSIADYWKNNNCKPLASAFVYDQETTIYRCGLLRTQLYCNILNYSPKENISAEDIAKIDRYLITKLESESLLPKDCYNTARRKNIDFIFVESWLSCVSGQKINDVEITPNLNRLAKLPGTYFNTMMLNNKTVGESSDAQVIYFIGLYPLRSRITISEILNKKLIALPNILKANGYTTHMTIPTRTYFWHQSEINKVYGVDSCYSTIKEGWENMSADNEVFELAYDKKKQMKEPYFHVILTSAMHGPYTTAIYGVDLDCSLKSDEYSDEYNNYLQKCHYTDREIGKYIDRLKKDGTYENTVFIIASDHCPNLEMLNTPKNKLSNGNIPLMIVNADIDCTNTVNGTINQIDVFPSILDLLEIDSKWRGLGHSIFRKGAFSPIVTKETRTISEQIIYSNYLSDY